MKNTHTWIRVIGRLAAERPTARPLDLANALVPMLDDDGALPSLADTPSARLDALHKKAVHLVGLWSKGHMPAKRTAAPTAPTGRRGPVSGTLPDTPDAFIATAKRSGRQRDFQRSAVYKWEDRTLGWMREPQMSMADIRALVQRVCSEYDIPVIPVVSDDRRRSACFGYKPTWKTPRHDGEVIMTYAGNGQDYSCQLRFCSGSKTRHVVLHELAHYFNAVIHGFMARAAHGPEFVAILCHLLGQYTVRSETDCRLSAMGQGLRVAPRS